MGGLINDKRFSQAAWKTSLSYSSPLLNHGLYKSRHFVAISYFSLLANDVKKTIGFTYDVPGLNSVKGLSTFEMNYEGVFFAHGIG